MDNMILIRCKILLLCVFVFLLGSCVSTNKTINNHRIEPQPFVTSLWIIGGLPSSLDSYHGFLGFNVSDTSSHKTFYTIENDHYTFHIFSSKDSAEIIIHKQYIGNNLDTVRILIFNTCDTSTINVYPNASWVRLGHIRTLVSDSQHSKGCFVKSTTPVSVIVDLIVNPMIDNVNPSYLEEEKNHIELYIDSLRDKVLKQL